MGDGVGPEGAVAEVEEELIDVSGGDCGVSIGNARVEKCSADFGEDGAR